jgi:pyruvate/2-oxoglutarate dehydrogenase complex dihydrolipoamide dehydrogenase (E3) component
VPISFELFTPATEEGAFPVIRVKYTQDGAEKSVEVEAVLVAAGRRPNIENIGLETAGVETNEEGVKVDNYLRTTNPDIFAVGDCCSSL